MKIAKNDDGKKACIGIGGLNMKKMSCFVWLHFVFVTSLCLLLLLGMVLSLLGCGVGEKNGLQLCQDGLEKLHAAPCYYENTIVTANMDDEQITLNVSDYWYHNGNWLGSTGSTPMTGMYLFYDGTYYTKIEISASDLNAASGDQWFAPEDQAGLAEKMKWGIAQVNLNDLEAKVLSQEETENGVCIMLSSRAEEQEEIVWTFYLNADGMIEKVEQRQKISLYDNEGNVVKADAFCVTVISYEEEPVKKAIDTQIQSLKN